MDKNKNNVLSVRDLEVYYTSEGKIVQAVNGVSFDLAQGKSLGLVGETGAGKTTIAKSIMRILPMPPAHIRNGSILCEGKDLLKISESEMRTYRGNTVGMIFQDPMTALNPLMTVADQISEGIRMHNRLSDREAFSETVKMLEMVGIPAERATDYPHQFSGGMKQRVVIAMALACNPKILIADEPTTALDVTIQAQVMSIIKNLVAERGTSMILITHDLGVVAETCDDVAVIYAGKIVEYGSKEQIFDHPSHPYTKGLFEALPDISKKTHRLKHIEGLPADPTNLPLGCAFHPRCPYVTEQCRTGAVGMRDCEGAGHLVRCIRDIQKEGAQ